MITRIEDSSEYFAELPIWTQRVRIRLFGVTVYRSEQVANGGPRAVWILGLLVYRFERRS